MEVKVLVEVVGNKVAEWDGPFEINQRQVCLKIARQATKHPTHIKHDPHGYFDEMTSYSYLQNRRRFEKFRMRAFCL